MASHGPRTSSSFAFYSPEGKASCSQAQEHSQHYSCNLSGCVVYVNFKLTCASLLIISDASGIKTFFEGPKMVWAPTDLYDRPGSGFNPHKEMSAALTPQISRRGAVIRGGSFIVEELSTSLLLYVLFREVSSDRDGSCSHVQESSQHHLCSCSHRYYCARCAL